MTDLMLDAKNARKRADCDMQLLANRLAHLRAEEAKAMKKIEETKSRADEIIRLKKENATIHKKKSISSSKKNAVESEEQQMIAMRRAKARADRKARMSDVQRSKMEDVMQ